MLKVVVFEPTRLEWASPVLIVPKTNGSLSFFIEYRKLNAFMVKDAYPILRMDEYIDSLETVKV